MFKLCQQTISNRQELYFLEDTATPILQIDTSDYAIGGYFTGAVDHGATDGASDGSGSNRRSDGRCERWIMERRMVEVIDQKVIGGVMDGASNR